MHGKQVHQDFIMWNYFVYDQTLRRTKSINGPSAEIIENKEKNGNSRPAFVASRLMQSSLSPCDRT